MPYALAAGVLPKVDHFMAQRALRLTRKGVGTKATGDDDLRRVDDEVPVAPAHPPAEEKRHSRQCVGEKVAVHPREFGH